MYYCRKRYYRRTLLEARSWQFAASLADLLAALVAATAITAAIAATTAVATTTVATTTTAISTAAVTAASVATTTTAISTAAVAAASVATAVATTPVATAITATIATATAGTTPGSALVGFFNDQLLFTKSYIFQVLDGVATIGLVLHFHKTKSPAFAGFFIEGYFGRNNRTKLFEDFYQFIIVQIIRQTGHKEFHTDISFV